MPRRRFFFASFFLAFSSSASCSFRTCSTDFPVFFASLYGLKVFSWMSSSSFFSSSYFFIWVVENTIIPPNMRNIITV